MDPVALARLQFAFTVAYHFLFVPISLGTGIFLVVSGRRWYKSQAPEDKAGFLFWMKLFTTTFAIGVATGITMEFAFGTNWATYSRFVGDIFGAPLAAEGALRLLPRIDLPRRAAVRPRPGLAHASTTSRPGSWSCGAHALGALDHHRQLLAADPGRVTRSRAARPC